MKEYINSVRSPLYDESKKRALDYIKVFENRFKNDIYPLIYVVEFVNPSLKLTLSPMELKQSISYIRPIHDKKFLSLKTPLFSKKHNIFAKM